MSKNNKTKREEAQAHNIAMEMAQNLMPIGVCGHCEKKDTLFVYLNSKLENSCTYYCLNCGHKGDLKNIDKKDSFFFSLKDVIGEIRRHYPEKEFEEFYNK